MGSYSRSWLICLSFILLSIVKVSYAVESIAESNNLLVEPHQKNFYAGAGLGAGINYFSPTNTTVSVANADHATMSYRLFAGYNLDKNFALELGYTNFGYYLNSASGNSICDPSGVCGFLNANPLAGTYNTELNVINTINSYALDLTTLARYNVTDSLNIFGRVGVSYLNASLNTKTIINPAISIGNTAIGPTINQNTTSTQTPILPLLGIGYEYNPNKFLGIRFEYDYYFSVNMINNQGVNEGVYTPSALFLSTIYNF